MGVLLDKLYQRRKDEGPNIGELSTTWLNANLKNPDSNVVRVIPKNQIVPGNFYFLFYDLGTNLKSSKMEQYSPVLALKTSYFKNKPILWAFNWNFMPERIRINWFDKLLSRFFKGILNTNAEIEQIQYQKPLNLTYEGVYRTLAKIGFEYSIREYRMDLIDRVYQINMNEVDKFLSANTQVYSGVDPQKLIQIWLAKLGEGEDRLKKIQEDILTDFKKIDIELEKSMDQLEKSKNFLSLI